MELKTILSDLLENKGITPYKIGKDTNVSKQSIMNYLQGKAMPTGDALIELSVYLGVSADYLLGINNENNIGNINDPIQEKGVPYFEDIESTGGIMSMFSDHPEIPTFLINYKHFNDCTAYIQHVGDSMFPKYCSGEIIAVKQITNLDVILWGEAYLVVTNGNANDMRTVKLLFQHDEESKIILRASNPAFKGDTVISISDITALFVVKGKITRNQI